MLKVIWRKILMNKKIIHLIIALVGIFVLRAVGRLVLLGVPGRILGIPGRSTFLRIGCLVFTVIVLRHNSSHSAV